MKYLKVTFIVFIFTTMLSTVLVSAATKGIAGLEIPILDDTANTGEHQKETEANQAFSLVKCTEAITGNETAVRVRTYLTKTGDYSSWLTAVKGSLKEISPGEHNFPAFYKLVAQAIEDDHLLPSSLYGTWYLG